MAQIFNPRLGEYAFLGVVEELVLSQNLEHCLQMKEVSCFRRTIYQNLIKENHDKVAKMILENVVREGLERYGSIGETQGHD